MVRVKFFLVFFFVAILSFGNSAGAFVFSGRVTDPKQLPIPYATVFIHEISTGIPTDIDGNFRVNLKPGNYTVEVSSLGYKREKFSFDLTKGDVDRQIVLEEEVYTLGDVYFRAGRENRAYHVMRQAIAMAPYHLRQVREYSSQVYMKGSVKVTKIPAVIRMQAGRKTTSLVLNKTFVVESKSNVKFTWPDNYQETVVAFSSTVPEEIDVTQFSTVNTASVYNREFYGKLSPLAPEAFNYYSFVYEGISNDNGHIVNKIRIIPKKGDSKLVSGHIYIADDLWSVTYARFFIRETGIDIDLKVNYNETAPEIFMPTSYSMDVDISLMGVRAGGVYNSSVTYSSVNSSLEKEAIASALPGKVVETAREARAFARNSAKVIKEEIAREDTSAVRGNGLEIKQVSNITRKVDSMATKRDSSYWASVRTVPLRQEEVVAYQEADSLKEEFQKIAEGEKGDAIRRSTGSVLFDRILYDSRYKVGKKLTLGYGGLSRVVGGFTFTDGYWLGQNFYSAYRFNKKANLVVEPAVYYSTYRKNVMWRVDAWLSHSPMKLGKSYISVGDFSRDLSDNSSISDFVGSYASFLFGMNPKKYHAVQWITAGNEIDVANGVHLDLSVNWSKVTPLVIGNVKSLTGKTASANLPDNLYDELPQGHSNLDYSVKVSYTPRYYYRVVSGRKDYVKSAWPTFVFAAEGSFLNDNSDYADWGKISLSMRHRINTGLYSLLVYGAEAGTFYNTERLFFDNFHHFRASNIMVVEDGFETDLMLADPYRYSTSKRWLKYNAEFRSNYIFLNNLPFLNSALYTEALYLKGLWLPDKRVVYTEAGYSFGIQGALKAGVFTAFEGNRYVGTGFRVEVPFLSEIYR